MISYLAYANFILSLSETHIYSLYNTILVMGWVRTRYWLYNTTWILALIYNCFTSAFISRLSNSDLITKQPILKVCMYSSPLLFCTHVLPLFSSSCFKATTAGMTVCISLFSYFCLRFVFSPQPWCQLLLQSNLYCHRVCIFPNSYCYFILSYQHY